MRFKSNEVTLSEDTRQMFFIVLNQWHILSTCFF
nr:MAG TPA: hypothetical protein [Caudoviricetes sp.]